MNDSEGDRSPNNSTDDDQRSFSPVAIHDLITAVFAEKLGLTAYEMEFLLIEGKPLWEIAREQDYTFDDMERVLHETREEVLSLALDKRLISAFQVDRVDRLITQQLSRQLQPSM